MPQTSPELFAHDDLENEWWYYHGHLSCGSRRFGFHLVFFRRRTDHLRVGRILRVERVSDQIRFAHFALTDIDRQQFHYGHRRSVVGVAGAASDRYEVWMGDWSISGRDQRHHLKASIRGIEFDVEVRPMKPMVKHGNDGFFPKTDGGKSFYFACPRMEAQGVIKIGQETLQVTGEAWMDREFGEFSIGPELHGWDWFAMQFADGRELVVYRMRDENGRQTERSEAALIGSDGSSTPLAASQIHVEPLDYWTSRLTRNVYPVQWRIELPEIEAELEVKPFMRCHEIDTRGSTNIIYWEGPGLVSGKVQGEQMVGRCYVELVGHECRAGRFGTFDFSSNNLGFVAWIANEFRLRRFGPGVDVMK